MSRYWVQRVGFALLCVAALAVVVPILLVIGIIVVEGIGAISWEFLTAMPFDGMKQGGIFPAIVGTLLLTLGTALVAIPIGVGGTIYLAEYARDTWVTPFHSAGHRQSGRDSIHCVRALRAGDVRAVSQDGYIHFGRGFDPGHHDPAGHHEHGGGSVARRAH